MLSEHAEQSIKVHESHRDHGWAKVSEKIVGKSEELDDQGRYGLKSQGGFCSSKFVLYLAVVPIYRDAAVRELLDIGKDQIKIFAGDAHLDPTVRTGLPAALVTRVRNTPLFGNRVLLQTGHLLEAFQADVCVVDLNPRSITAWGIALARKAMRKRTLVWGHLHPRSGGSSRTAILRRLLRRLADGTILYGYDSVIPARTELPEQPVWVAANALYRREDIDYRPGRKTKILYVGRLEISKNVHMLIESFKLSGLADRGYTLDVVGFGSLADSLVEQAEQFGVSDSVIFHGRIDNVDDLKGLYSQSVLSVSPGYIGLGLTQSLGFGIPMLYANDAPHSPEIELAKFGGVFGFEPTTIEGLADGLKAYISVADSSNQDGAALSNLVGRYYSAEAMACGLWRALQNQSPQLGADGWPMI